MKILVGLILFCSALISVDYVLGSDAPDFMLLAPKSLTAGTTSKICLTVYNQTVDGKAAIRLLDSQKKEIASVGGKICKNLKCFELQVPETLETDGFIELEATYPDRDAIKQTKPIRINKDFAITLIETDKAVYKPDQSVKIRILTINNNLEPLYEKISKVWIENPSGTRLTQWLNVAIDTGLVQLEFPLSSEPALGEWKIFVSRTDTADPEIKTFKIEKYVLPRFQVTISNTPKVLQDTENIEYNICAKYSYGKPVKGDLNVTIEASKGYGPRIFEWDAKRTYNFTKKLDSADGCYKLKVTGKELELDRDLTRKLTVKVNLKEAGVDETESAEASQDIEQNAIKIETISKNYLKIGIPSVFKVKATRNDNDQPASNEPLEVCLTLGDDTCQNFTTNADGIIQFVLPPLYNSSIGNSLTLKTSAIQHPEKPIEGSKEGYYRLMYASSTSYYTTSWTSPSNSFIDMITNDDETVSCGKSLKFKVYYTVPVDSKPDPIKFTYMVQSKGNIIQTGVQTPDIKETTSDSIVNSNDLMGIPVFKYSDASTPQNKLYEFELSINVTPEMSPSAKLLIYYTRSDREVVSTYRDLKIDHCFQNQVDASWKKNEIYPGEEGQLEVKAAPKSLCSISAVDKSSSFLGKSSKITKEQIFDSLKRFQLDANSAPVQAGSFDHCAHYVDPNDKETTTNAYPYSNREYVPAYNVKDAIESFDEFGCLIMTNLTVETRKCVNRPYLLASLGDVFNKVETLEYTLVSDSISPAMPASSSNNFAARAPAVRSFFPETWLWDLAATDENGKLVIDRKIPDSITDWQTTVTCLSKDKGIGVANPQEIRAFQPFFLEYVTPYSVKRGEILHLQVIVHNYVDHALPIRVTLEKAEGISQVGDEASVSQCIESLGSLAHTFKIKASELGDVNVTVSAKVDTRFSGKCGEEQKVKGVTHRDVIIKPIRVEPEGYPVEQLQATYVCPKDNATGPVVRNWEFKLPENLVEGSARGKVMAIGEIMGPALNNLDRLVQIPTGCGEQNMLLFTPNLHVLAYLKALNIQNPKLKDQALKNMKTGYEREQNYRHNDASFSAFGQSDDSGSLWLTAFVVRSFAQSRPHIFVDDKKLQESMDWIISKQMDVSGCFPTVGLVLHKDLLGGLQRDESNIALTAYVLASLLETGLPVKPMVIEQAKSCLKQTPAKTPDVYSKALTAYALSLANMTTDSNKILDELVDKVKKEDDNLVYWDNEGSTSLELSIEITSYVILTMLRTHNEKYAAITYNAIRWISSHRNENGGFVSTQDTILALEALSKYAASLNNDKTDIAIRIKATGLDQPLAVTDADKMVLKQIPLPKLPTDVEVTTSGSGCVLLQGVLRYNTHAIEDSHAFGLDIHIDTTQYSCTEQKLKVCTWYKLDSENTNMAILEIEMPTGYEPSELTLQSLIYQHKNVKRYEIENNKVIIYFSELSKDRTCVEFQISEKTKVEKRTPAVVKVFDYYNQKLQESSNYKLEESCHAKPVPHNEGGHNHPDHPLTDPIPFLNEPVAAQA